MDLITKAPQQEQISQDSPSLQASPGTGQQSFVFGDWGGLRSWLSNHGIDLGLSYLSEPAWDVAGGMARGGTYAGQENLSLDLNWEKIASINGFSTHIDFVSRLGSSNVSSKYVGDVLFQAQEIYGSPSVVQAVTHLAYFYGEQQLFNGNVDLKAGRIPVRNDFGTLPGTCFDFMSLSICANPSSTSNLSWTVFPVANWGGVAEFKISGPSKSAAMKSTRTTAANMASPGGLTAPRAFSFPRNSTGMWTLDHSSSTGFIRSAVPTIRRHYPIGSRPRTACRCP